MVEFSAANGECNISDRRAACGPPFSLGGGPGRKAVAASPICEQQIGQMRV
jgi:hypothetical protein